MARLNGSSVTITDLSDSFSVILSNEAHSFNEENTNRSTTTTVYAYQGADRVTATVDISKITLPSGVTVTSDGKSPAPTLTFTLDNSVQTDGFIDFDVVINAGEVTVTKRFSWSVARKGQAGKSSYLHIKYAPNSNPSQSEISEIPNKYIGQYVDDQVQDSNNPSDYVWRQFEPDKPVSALPIVKKYGVSFTDDVEPTDWFDDAPSLDVDHRYLWSKEIHEFSDNSKVEYDPMIIALFDPVPVLMVDSSNGNVFKNTQISTNLIVSIIYGSLEITDSTTLKHYFGKDAKIVWSQKILGNTIFQPISETDPRLSAEGFLLSVNAGDVNERTVFNCALDC